MAEQKETAMAHWEPFSDRDLFEEWGPFWGVGPRWRAPRLLRELLAEPAPGATAVKPAIDVSEADGRYVVTVELPGCRKDDVSVELEENVLTVRGEKKSEREEKKEKRHYVERRFGSFVRSLRLPSDADPEGVKATFKDGVLTVEITRSEAAKPRQISIK